MGTDIHFVEKGYEPLHIRKETLLDGWGETGIDHIFKKNGKYYIVESKFKGYAKLGSTADGPQMSKDWIESSDRLIKALSGNKAIRDEILNFGYSRLLSEVLENGTVILKNIDESGKVGTVFKYQ